MLNLASVAMARSVQLLPTCSYYIIIQLYVLLIFKEQVEPTQVAHLANNCSGDPATTKRVPVKDAGRAMIKARSLQKYMD